MSSSSPLQGRVKCLFDDERKGENSSEAGEFLLSSVPDKRKANWSMGSRGRWIDRVRN